MAYRAAVVGGSGYTGAELLRLLAAHPEIEVVHVTADSNAGAAVGDLYPSLAAAYPALEYASYVPADLAGVDVAFVALPHGESQLIAPALVDRVAHVVDLGADFRLPASVYEKWYGKAHTAPDLLDGFAFGLPELFGDAVGRGAHVTPPLVPMTRGLLATCHARPSRDGLTTESLLESFRTFYVGAPFVGVLDEPPVTKATLGSNAAHVTVRFDDRTGSVLALCALDNLGKGASGQAIQCANLVLGLPETTGLPSVGIMP